MVLKNKPRWTLQQKIWISFLLIYLIPFVILGALLYDNAVVQLRKQIEKTTLDGLMTARNELEQTLSRLDSLSVHISADPELTPYHARQNAHLSDGTINALQRYKSYNPLIEDILLHYRGEDALYTTQGISSLRTAVEYMYAFPTMDWKTSVFSLQRLFEELERPAIIPANKMANRYTEDSQHLAYLSPIPPGSLAYYGTVVYLLDREKLTGTILQPLGDISGAMRIVDDEGTVIAAAAKGTNFPLEELYAAMEERRTEGIHETVVRGERYSLSVVRSESLGWSFVAAMPTRQFLSRVVDMETFLLLVLSMLLLAGCGIGLLLSRRFYRPIRRLLDSIRDHLTPAHAESASDLQLIEETWKRMNEQIEQQRGVVRERYVYRLIKGIPHPAAEPKSGAAPVPAELLQADRYFAAHIVLDIPEERMLSSANIEDIAGWLARFSLPPHLEAFGVELIDRFAYAVVAGVKDTGGERTDMRRLQLRLADAVRTRMKEKYGIAAFVGLGGTAEHADEIGRSYLEAAAAAELRIVSGKDGVVFFEDMRHSGGQSGPWLPADEQLRFLQSLKQGDRDMAEQLLQTLIERIRSRESSQPMVKLACFDLIATVAKQSPDLKSAEDAALIRKAAEFRDLDELRGILEELIRRICEHAAAEQVNKQSRLCEEMLEFIREQFASPAMCLDFVAERFQLSPSHVSRFLKEQAGISFSEYLFELRHEEAKRLLAGTDKTIKEIVQSVGYAGESKFIERFRKKEGVTPGAYRKLVREHG